MKPIHQVLIVGLLFSVLFTQGLEPQLFASEARVLKDKTPSGFKVAELNGSFLKQLRLLKNKQESEMLEESFCLNRRGGENKPAKRSSTSIQREIKEEQKASPLGLVESFPNDASLDNQAFTYDQALAGLVLLGQGDLKAAGQIFHFFDSQWDGHGFFTVYNTQDAQGSRVEQARTLGPNAWVGLFALHYYDKTGDEQALALALNIGKWAAEKVPHHNGGLAMGESDIWSGIFSTENNLSYYALANALSVKARDNVDRQLFRAEKEGAAAWIKSEGYDSSKGLFKRGPSDDTASFDVNSWAILAFGASEAPQDLATKMEEAFAVQPDGTFGGGIDTAKGFDFSDGSNASLAGRSGMKWVEGTNHMVVAYQTLSSYWKSRDAALSQQYLKKAQRFLALDSSDAFSQNGRTSYRYTDAPAGTLIFHDIASWRTPSGPGLASTAWVYFALNGINPFEI